MQIKKMTFFFAILLFCWGQVLAKYELIVTQPTTTNPCNGLITATATGNTGPFIFEWFNEDGTPVDANLVVSDDYSSTLNNYCSGIYEVIVTNKFDCETVLFEKTDLDIAVFLEGAYNLNENEMKTTLSSERSILPGQTPVNGAIEKIPSGQPYGAAPYSYSGKEGVDWTDYQIDKNYIDVVDWVLVSLRTGLKKSTEIERRSGLLKKDGSIFFPINFSKLSGIESVYVVIEHRNHLAISSPLIKVENSTIYYDFTLSDSYTGADENGVGANGAGQKELSNEKWGMITGDGDQVGSRSDINGADKIAWEQQNGKFDRYNSTCDFNFDSDVNGADKIIWEKANGNFGAVNFND